MKGEVRKVELLGHGEPLPFSQDADGLKVKLPSEKPCDYIYTLRITGLKLT
jgi:alpha-L-fucosidase